MGRIYKRFRIKTAAGSASGIGKIDNGADRTLIRFETACRLGLDPMTAKTVTMRAAGSRLYGFLFPVEMKVGDRTAKVEAFVARFTRSGKHLRAVHPPNLIGADFMQSAKVQLDYRKPHRRVFSESWSWDWEFRPTTPAERRMLRRTTRCPRR